MNVGKYRSTEWSLVNTLIPEKTAGNGRERNGKKIMQVYQAENITMNVLPEIKRIFKDTKEVSSKLSINTITGETADFII